MTLKQSFSKKVRAYSPRLWLYTKSLVSIWRRATRTMDFPVTYYPTLKAVYLQVPKTATSTTSSLFLKKLGVVFDDTNYHSIHAHAAPYFVKDENELQKIRKQGEVFTFGFVRNPYTRLISCYKDKIQTEKDTDFFNDYFGLFTPSMNFTDFINAICKIPDFWANTHFKSQTSFLFFKNQPKPNFIGKFENYTEDIKVVQERLLLPDIEQSFNITGRSYDLHEWYDVELADKVYKRFKNDFETFGYAKTIT